MTSWLPSVAGGSAASLGSSSSASDASLWSSHLLLCCLVVAERSASLALGNALNVVISSEGSSVVPSGLTVNWSGSGSQLLEVLALDALALHEAVVVVLRSHDALVVVAVALSVSDVICEQIKLSIVVVQVVHGGVEEGCGSGDVETLEPVQSHGVDNVLDWLRVNDGTLDNSEDSIGFDHEGVLSVEVESLHSVHKIGEGIGGIAESVGLSLVEILLLFLEEVELESEWSLDLNEVVVVDVSKSHLLLDHAIVEVLSSSIVKVNDKSTSNARGIINRVERVINVTSTSSIEGACASVHTSDLVEDCNINGLNAVVADDVGVRVLNSVLELSLVGHLVAVAVAVLEAVSDAIAVAVGSSEGWVAVTLVNEAAH